jgi:hypothetical protein
VGFQDSQRILRVSLMNLNETFSPFALSLPTHPCFPCKVDQALTAKTPERERKVTAEKK